MAAPTRVARLASAFNTNTTPKTAGTFNVSTGDILVVKAVAEDGGKVFGTPTGLTGATWTQRVLVGTSGNSCKLGVWTTVAPGAQSGVTISVTGTTTASGSYGIEVSQYSAATVSGIGQVWSGVITTGSGAPSVTATATGADSVIDMAVADWNATATTGKTYRTADAGSFTENTSAQVGSNYTYYLGYYPDSGTAASKVIGLSAPSGMRWALGGVEVLGSSGTTFTASVTATAGATATPVRAATNARSSVAGATVQRSSAATAARGATATGAATATRSTSKATAATAAGSASASSVKVQLVTVAATAGAVATRNIAATKSVAAAAVAAAAPTRATARSASATAASVATAASLRVRLVSVTATAGAAATVARAAQHSAQASTSTIARATRAVTHRVTAIAAAVASLFIPTDTVPIVNLEQARTATFVTTGATTATFETSATTAALERPSTGASFERAAVSASFEQATGELVI